MNMNKTRGFGSLPALIISTILFSGCSSMGGEVRKDASLTEGSGFIKGDILRLVQ